MATAGSFNSKNGGSSSASFLHPIIWQTRRDEASIHRMTEIRTYDGDFSFKILPREKADLLDELFAEGGFEVDIALQSLEFSWMGRDPDGRILKIFIAAAQILQDAEGELRCEIDDDQPDPRFEFFTIKQGRLMLQRGTLVRGSELIPQI